MLGLPRLLELREEVRHRVLNPFRQERSQGATVRISQDPDVGKLFPAIGNTIMVYTSQNNVVYPPENSVVGSVILQS